nr:resuscitation-promoting factor [Auraticoccus cholistanensis]
MEKTVELSVDGVPTTVTTFRSDVGDLLEQQGLEVGPNDVVAPAAETPIDDGDRVTVQYGRQVTVDVDGTEQTHWTTATTVGEALALLQIKAEGAELSTSRSAGIGREGLAFSVDTLKELTLVVGGKKRTVESTAATVREVLADADVETDRDDRVHPALGTEVEDGTKITVVRVEVKDVKKTSAVAHKTVRQETDDLDKGTTRVQTEGKDGERTTVITQTRENGKVVKEKEKSSEVTTEPVDEVVLVGTRVEAPAPAPRKQSSSSSSSGSSSGGSSSSDSDTDSGSDDSSSSSSGSDAVWDRLAQCESGGNWSINTGNGYYGGVQFSAQTWKAYGGKGLPHENSKAEQIRIAKKLQAAAGWGQWPHCSAKLGLR